MPCASITGAQSSRVNFQFKEMRLFSKRVGTRPGLGSFREKAKLFLLVTRMPSNIVVRVFFAVSIALLFAAVFIQQDPAPFRSVSLSYSPENMRHLSAQEINSRTLALAAAINDPAK